MAVAPVLAFLLLSHALRPGTPVAAPRRLAAVRAALATGGFAVLMVEGLGAVGGLNVAAFALGWLAFLTACGVLAWRRRRTDLGSGPAPGPAVGPVRSWVGSARRLPRAAREFWRQAAVADRLLAGTVGGLVLVEFGIALLAEPNNFDSQTYHLPKVEHWVAQGSLDFWPTAIHRQVTIPPGAEYLLLHLRLFTSGDALHNLVQWAAGVGCLVAATRIVAQLGGSRRAQLLAAFLLATTPMIALQATSTQTDLVVAAWVAAAATLVLDGLTRPATAGSVLALGAATGLTAITKTSGLLGVGPLLVFWGVAQLRLAWTGTAGQPAWTGTAGQPARTGTAGRVRGLARVVGSGVAVLVVAAAFTGPFLVRVAAEFGHPLGPPRLRESIPMQRHDPGSVLINGLRIGHTALDTPVGVLRDATASAIRGTAGVLGVDPQDRATTFGQTTWPVRSWYPDEDRVAFPLVGALMLLGAGFALARPARLAPRHPTVLRGYAATVTAAVLLHVTMIKWQPWGNRLLVYALVLAAPLAALWLAALFRRPDSQPDRQPDRSADGQTERQIDGQTGNRAGRQPQQQSVAALVAVAVLATCALAGVLAISYGFPRRLVGSGSLLTSSDWETRFLRRPQWAEEFRWAADAVRASDARRVGLVQQNDNWEYPWWLLLRDGNELELVALQSVLPDRPPARPDTVDAIVCTGTRAACTRLVPDGWQVRFRGYVGYALPPG
ncbi:hypothetical protein O7627_35250 [Solwaraspora sp. WMMD1047]|uniref:hypothetical protein n=1 Tax=Solwaraspora sp. WMMD1047 TaxID=3016102 RepID=UPI002415E0F2|nr:hypothetical protein [Solwaraspora sp. WMMD1047]MDG4834527.1 hypothetical protein [Solwaraspora sp. WMMD1047]